MCTWYSFRTFVLCRQHPPEKCLAFVTHDCDVAEKSNSVHDGCCTDFCTIATSIILLNWIPCQSRGKRQIKKKKKKKKIARERCCWNERVQLFDGRFTQCEAKHVREWTVTLASVIDLLFAWMWIFNKICIRFLNSYTRRLLRAPASQV